MHVTVALRGGENRTDRHALALMEGLERLPNIKVRVIARGEKLPSCADMFVQVGFAKTTPLIASIIEGIPYLILEEPSFRGFYENAATFTYNGLQAGGTRPRVPDRPRPHPDLLSITPNTNGKTLILGQKPNDHSLRGSDHIQWIKDKMKEYPDAGFRPHPLMVPKESLDPLSDVLSDCGRTISYTSTAAVDSLFAGCRTICEHPASEAYEVKDRQEWAHRLSWYNLRHAELAQPQFALWVLEGYPEAKENAQNGIQEHPRDKLTGPSTYGDLI